MATYYVRNSATGANNGTSWANAYTEFVSARNVAVGGDTIYVASDHLGPIHTSNNALGFNTSPGTPLYVIAVDPSSQPPTQVVPYGTRAMLSHAGNMLLSGYAYFYGIRFTAASGVSIDNTYATCQMVFENCQFDCPAQGVGVSRYNAYSTNSHVVFKNCDVNFTTTANRRFNVYGTMSFLWKGGKWYTATNLADPVGIISFTSASNNHPKTELNGIDFSTGQWATSLLRVFNLGAGRHELTVTNCKLRDFDGLFNSAEPPFLEASVLAKSVNVNSCNSFKNFYTTFRFSGSNTRSGGQRGLCSESYVTSPVPAMAISKSENARVSQSFEGVGSSTALNRMFFEQPIHDPILVWNDIVGVPITVKVLANRGSTPTTQNGNERWLEVSYPGDATSPLYKVAKSNGGAGEASPTFGEIGTASTVPTGGTWASPSLSPATVPILRSFEYSVTFTPQAKGFLAVRFVTMGHVEQNIDAGGNGRYFFLNPKVTVTT